MGKSSIPQRYANASLPEGDALKATWIGFSEDDHRFAVDGAVFFADALRTTRSTYKPISSRTYFTGGLP
jgi:hypothetical protein